VLDSRKYCAILLVMPDNQLPLFSRKSFPAVSAPSPIPIVVPTAESTVMSTLLAYRVYVSSVSESKYTPGDFCGDRGHFETPQSRSVEKGLAE